MKLLVVNPNISTEVTGLIGAEAHRSVAPGTELVTATAGYGVEYIETRAESLIAAPAVAQLIAEHHSQVDGVVVAAFGDPGLPGLKELVDVPVVGITEAALAVAALQGRRFSIVAISDRITAWYRECVQDNGLSSRLASIRSLKDPLAGIGTVQTDFRDRLLELSHEVVEQDGADVVILAGAPLAGLAREIKHLIPVPVVDGIASGVVMCEALVRLECGLHRRGSFAPPPAKPNRGLPEALAGLYGRTQPEADPAEAPTTEGARA